MVYEITNIINSRKYIGVSIKTDEKSKREYYESSQGCISDILKKKEVINGYGVN